MPLIEVREVCTFDSRNKTCLFVTEFGVSMRSVDGYPLFVHGQVVHGVCGMHLDEDKRKPSTKKECSTMVVYNSHVFARTISCNQLFDRSLSQPEICEDSMPTFKLGKYRVDTGIKTFGPFAHRPKPCRDVSPERSRSRRTEYSSQDNMGLGDFFLGEPKGIRRDSSGRAYYSRPSRKSGHSRTQSVRERPSTARGSLGGRRGGPEYYDSSDEPQYGEHRRPGPPHVCGSQGTRRYEPEYDEFSDEPQPQYREHRHPGASSPRPPPPREESYSGPEPSSRVPQRGGRGGPVICADEILEKFESVIEGLDNWLASMVERGYQVDVPAGAGEIENAALPITGNYRYLQGQISINTRQLFGAASGNPGGRPGRRGPPPPPPAWGGGSPGDPGAFEGPPPHARGGGGGPAPEVRDGVVYEERRPAGAEDDGEWD